VCGVVLDHQYFELVVHFGEIRHDVQEQLMLLNKRIIPTLVHLYDLVEHYVEVLIDHVVTKNFGQDG
jgi:hypothetical protein